MPIKPFLIFICKIFFPEVFPILTVESFLLLEFLRIRAKRVKYFFFSFQVDQNSFRTQEKLVRSEASPQQVSFSLTRRIFFFTEIHNMKHQKVSSKINSGVNDSFNLFFGLT